MRIAMAMTKTNTTKVIIIHNKMIIMRIKIGNDIKI